MFHRRGEHNQQFLLSKQTQKKTHTETTGMLPLGMICVLASELVSRKITRLNSVYSLYFSWQMIDNKQEKT